MNEKKEITDRLSTALRALARIPVYDEASCLAKGSAMQYIRTAAEILEKCKVESVADNTNEKK